MLLPKFHPAGAFPAPSSPTRRAPILLLVFWLRLLYVFARVMSRTRTRPEATAPGNSLRAHLDYEPVPLKFGTSGRRGLVVHLTQLEVYLNAMAELEYLQSLPLAEGGIARGDEFYFACDLRPSSSRFVPAEQGRGELAQAIARAIQDAGMKPVFLGEIPTPALAAYALGRGKGSMMVTGSHIPFDRNGYKTNTARGELLKKDEAPIQTRVEQVRARLYAQPLAESPFNSQGLFKSGHQELPGENRAARKAYLQRYTDFFAEHSLKGKRLLVYQHSAVGRDLLVELLRRLGAEVIPAGRSEAFVPIDTENIDDAQLRVIQSLAAEAWRAHGPLDAVVSTDGDSDRPLLLAVNAMSDSEAPCRVQFFGGDLLGMVVAQFLGADAVVVPISCNDAVERGALQPALEPRTRIGSPYVIAGMEQALAKGRKVVCGWEANGGFLTGSDIERADRTLKALPTRDAFLPLLTALFSAAEKGLSLSALFGQLPQRFSRAALLRNFPRPVSRRIVERFSPADPKLKEAAFEPERVVLRDEAGRETATADSAAAALRCMREELARFFSPALGFGSIQRLNYIDGVRVYFDNGDIAHFRPSGNADELRIYAVADTRERAEAIAKMGVAEPDGILRRLESLVTQDPSQQNTRQPLTPSPGLLRLKGVVQHYDWGGFDFIPALLGLPHPSARPCAELWMGAHPNGPSLAQLGEAAVPLPQLIQRAPREVLGPQVAARFHNRLPYLFKVLDARKMLSIQAHPTLAQAAEGFAREEAAGIPLSAPNRNYKDSNHKPEVHVALTEFWMLHGFRPLEEIAATLEAAPELRALMPDLAARLAQTGTDEPARQGLLRELYQKAMTQPQAEVDAILTPLLERLDKEPAPARDNPDFWALRAAKFFPLPNGHRDRGIFSVYLLNLVRLQPGQGTFQPAGTLHAYLEGVNVELMANSDNVLRGGLTPKHVDVPELMRVLRFASQKPEILSGMEVSALETVYPTPAEEFELSRLRLSEGCGYQGGPGHGPELLVVLEGAVAASSAGQTLALRRGDIFLAPAGAFYTLEPQGETAVLFRGATPRSISTGSKA